MKKNSEALAVFIDLVTFLERQYDMKVCIFYTDFVEFNSVVIKAYFAQKRIKWEVSTPYTQQQNGFIKRHIRTTIQEACTIMVNSSLFFSSLDQSNIHYGLYHK